MSSATSVPVTPPALSSHSATGSTRAPPSRSPSSTPSLPFSALRRGDARPALTPETVHHPHRHAPSRHARPSQPAISHVCLAATRDCAPRPPPDVCIPLSLHTHTHTPFSFSAPLLSLLLPERTFCLAACTSSFQRPGPGLAILSPAPLRPSHQNRIRISPAAQQKHRGRPNHVEALRPSSSLYKVCTFSCVSRVLDRQRQAHSLPLALLASRGSTILGPSHISDDASCTLRSLRSIKFCRVAQPVRTVLS